VQMKNLVSDDLTGLLASSEVECTLSPEFVLKVSERPSECPYFPAILIAIGAEKDSDHDLLITTVGVNVNPRRVLRMKRKLSNLMVPMNPLDYSRAVAVFTGLKSFTFLSKTEKLSG
jgi:hypothetical protein